MTRIMLLATALAIVTLGLAPAAQAQDRDGMRSHRMQNEERGEHREMREHRQMRGDQDRDDRNRKEVHFPQQNCELRVAGKCLIR